MRIIIPMAGRGTRLRPHTLTIPKPLIPVAGKPIVQRLVEDLAVAYGDKIDEIAFITGDFGEAVEADLIKIAESLGAKGTIYQQEEALGVGHAIFCAKESLKGPTIIAFADTLFKADFIFDPSNDGVIWVQRVEDPSSFGVVKLNEEGIIKEFIEKPSTFVSDMAIVGIYYFLEGEKLRAALDHIISNNIKEKNEFQLTTALEMLKQSGLKFRTGEVEEWLDCGNKDNILHSNARMLEFHKNNGQLKRNATLENSVILEPCFIGDGAVLKNSVVGPYVSLGAGSTIENSIVSKSVIQNNAHIENAVLENSMIGNSSKFIGTKSDLSLGDFSDLSL